jgi:hypothetical protein
MTNYIGSVVAVAAGVPATFDKAGYEALTWVVVNGLQTAPIPGMETATIDVPDLTTGITKREKGASIGRETEMAFRDVPADPGQEDVKEYAAPDYGAEVSVRIVLPNGANNHVYMSGIMYSYMMNEGTTESYRGFSVTFAQNYEEVITTAPTP